jgi:D-apionolactonase
MTDDADFRPDDAIRIFGRAESRVPPLALRAGPLTALLDGPDLRHVRLGGVELVQRVYIAVRDAPWNTIPADYSEWQRDVDADRFSIRFRARHRHEDIDFEWVGRIEGTPDGRITYKMDGVCHGRFAYSKIGVNVHHDLPGSIGRPYRARQADRTWTGRLPVAIEPQRIVDGTLTGVFDPYEVLAIEVVAGLEAVIGLEGDLLELQDHRNWTDANLKSYGTPLALGFPFESTDGQRLHQILTIGFRGTPVERAAPQLAIHVGRATGSRMPTIGLGMASDGRRLAMAEAELIRALAPEHLRVDLALRGDAWRSELDRAIEDAFAAGSALELAIHVPTPDHDGDAAAAALGRRLAGASVPIARVLVYPLADGFSALASTTPLDRIWLLRHALEHVIGPDVVLAGGTDQSFADINRSRPAPGTMAGWCWAISPTVHAADDASIIENLAGQSEVVRFARDISGSSSIHISPVTLATRNGPYPGGPPVPGDLPPAVDVRQLSLLGAAWTAASIGELARSGATSVTYYETAGWRGVIERADGSPMPDRFPSRPGQAFPLFHPLGDALEVRDGAVRELVPSDPQQLGGFAVDTQNGVVAVVSNLTAAPLAFDVTGLPAAAVSCRILDTRTVGRATDDPIAWRRSSGRRIPVVDGAIRIELKPYGIVRLGAVP